MKNLYLTLIGIFLFIYSSAALCPGSTTGSTDGLNASGPTITYTPLSITSCSANRNFTATITDIDGVNALAGTKPRIYYKRSTDSDNWVNNTSLSNGWKYVEASNAASPFNFTINYSLLFLGTGVTAGDYIQYFIVAQDLAIVPNVSANDAIFSATPATVALDASAFPVSGTINDYKIVAALNTTLTVGLLGNYASLTGPTGLFNAINTNGLSGNTTVNLLDASILETGTVALSQTVNSGCAAGTASLLIKPNAGVVTTMLGNYDGTLIRLLSSNVTLDGSNNGTTGRNLTITNANLNAPSVVLLGSTGTDPIINSTLKNTILINGINTVNPVVISDGTEPGDPGYFNNITIQNNSVQTGFVGIYCVAVPATGNGSVLIVDNDLNTPGANSIRLNPIYCQGLDGVVISNNNLGNIINTAESNITGIWLAFGTKNATVTGNVISSIVGTIGAARGIAISSGVAAANINISGNTINGLSTSSTGTPSGVLLFANTGGIQIQKNTIHNIRNSNTTNSGCNGIQLSSGLVNASISVTNNFIFDIAGYGKASAGLADNGYGIVINSGGGYNVDHNSINLNTDQSVPGISAAINITSGVTGPASINLRNNIFSNTQSATSGAATRYAIYCGAPSVVFNAIDYNNYYSAGTNLGFIGGTARVTLDDLQTGFGGNLYAQNAQPNFVSASNLHLTAGGNCRFDGYGLPLAGITVDVDEQLRNVVTPDVGADEFTASPIANTISNSSFCDAKPISLSGSYYIDNSCNLIARVLPAGAEPVTGIVKTCVTLDATQQYFNGDPYVRRHFDIDPVAGNPATASANITLYFTNNEFVQYNTSNALWPRMPTLAGGGNSDPNRANVKVTQFHGTANSFPSSPGNYPGVRELITPAVNNVFWNGSFWEVSFNITGFSGFYVHSNNYNAPLPLVVNYFTGKKQGSSHLLNWKITCNSSTRVITTLERSADGAHFKPIDVTHADAARCNQPFFYTDVEPLPGINYYRLKNQDDAGKITYSTVVSLLNASQGVRITGLEPNPVTVDWLQVNIASAHAGKLNMVIVDMQGRVVNRQAVAVVAGFNKIKIWAGGLAPGTYGIKAVMDDNLSGITRFVKL